MTPEIATRQALAALRDAGIGSQILDIQSAPVRDRLELPTGAVVWDYPAIRTRVIIGDAAPQLRAALASKIQDALWTLDAVERSGYDGQCLISVFRSFEEAKSDDSAGGKTARASSRSRSGSTTSPRARR